MSLTSESLCVVGIYFSLVRSTVKQRFLDRASTPCIFPLDMAAACPDDFNSAMRSDKRKNLLGVLDEKRIAHVFFTWTIENFHLMPEDEKKYLVSPSFNVESVDSAWFLTFIPYQNLDDRKCSRIDLFRRNFNEAYNTITVTYRTGIRISNVDTWFQEKRAVSFGPNDLSSTAFYTRDFFRNDNVFHQKTMIVLCEMYLSQVTTEDSAWEKKFSLETKDLLRLSLDFSKLTAKSKESDVTIRIKDSTIPSHKAILAARSPVFARLLKDQRSSIKLKDEDSEHIHNILAYIYSGCLPSISKKRKLCIGLYECAERYSINGLKELLVPTQISGRTSISVEKINFTWTIENFSTLPLKANECIVSAPFSNGGKDASNWYLELYPKGRLETPNSVGIFVRNTEVRDTLNVSIQVSIVDKNLSERFKKCIDNIWVPLSVYGFPKFIDKTNLGEHLLENDQLILNCKIKLRIQTSFLDKSSLICYSSLAEHTGFERLSKNFEKLFCSEICSDATIVMDGELLHFHKTVLAARSPVFARRIKDSDNDCVIGVTDVRGDIFEKLIFYIYTGKLRKLTPITAIQLYEAAKNYEVECLAKRCLRFMTFSLDTECFRDVFLFTNQHKVKILMTSCAKFFKRNREEILSSIEWENFSITKSDFLSKLSTWLPESDDDDQRSVEK